MPVKEEKIDRCFFPGIFQSWSYLVIERQRERERERERDRMYLRETTSGRLSTCLIISSSTQDKWVSSSWWCLFFWTKATLSNFTTSRKALGWWITLGTPALFQRNGMRFWAAKVFFKSHCFLWLPPSCKWLCRWEWPIQRQRKTPFPELHKPHLNFSDCSLFCAAFLRMSDGVVIRYQGACRFWFDFIYDRMKSWVLSNLLSSASWDESLLSSVGGEENGFGSEPDLAYSVTLLPHCVFNLWASVSSFMK